MPHAEMIQLLKDVEKDIVEAHGTYGKKLGYEIPRVATLMTPPVIKKVQAAVSPATPTTPPTTSPPLDLAALISAAVHKATGAHAYPTASLPPTRSAGRPTQPDCPDQLKYGKCTKNNCTYFHMPNNNPTDKCRYGCDKAPGYDGHLFIDCPKRICYTCNTLGHSKHRCPKEKCGLCGEMGHTNFSHGIPKG
jgi:hypothetical protein